MNPLRVLIIGVGSIGERHLRCFAATGRARLCLCEPNDRLRTEVAQRYDIQQAYTSLDAALADPPDAAVIATPAPLHVPIARRLAEASVHLLIEKPLSTSMDGVDELAAAVRQRKRVAAVAYVHRQHPALAEMRRAIVAGEFGRPVQLVAVSGQHFPTYRPAYREIYYRDRAAGGGAIQDALTHILNTGEWLAGPIERLVADASHQLLEGVEVEDTAHVLTRQGTLLGSYCLNQYQAPNETTITVACERGTARYEAHHHRWSSMTEPGGEWTHHPHAVPERDALFVRQAAAFLDALAGAEPTCTLAEGIQTLRVNLAALESAAGGRWIDLPAGNL